jgi:hypothetical protein
MIYGTPEFDELLKDVISNEKRHESYEECCEHAEEMSWHLYGVTPVKLLERTRPNEDPEIKSYRIENYEPITKSAADKAVHIVSKIFNPNLYSVRWKDKNASSEELKKYTLEYYPSYNSIVNFMKDVLLRKMLADPNGVAAVTVEEVPDLESVRLSPVLKIYGSKAIYYQDEDHYLILTKIEDEKIYYFDYFDKDRTVSFYTYVKRSPAGDGDEIVLVEEKNYEYEFSEIPVWKLRGMSESMDNGDIIFKSYFSSAVPYWNNAITHESDVFASYIRHMYPQRYELTEPCNYKMEYEGQMYPCRSGYIIHPQFGKSACSHCSGTGYNPVSPYGVYQYTKDKLSESGPLGVDPVGYITVPTDATKMLEERAQRMITEGMWSINMDVEDEVGENQSGIAKVIDRSAQYDTLYNIGSVVFDVHLTNFYYFANKFMFGVEAVSSNKGSEVVDKNLPEINKPTQFDIGSVSEAIANLKAARDAGLDNDIIQVKQIEVAARDLTTNPDLKLFATLMLEIDPLPGMTQTDVDRNVSRGYVRKVDAVIHFNKKAFLERATRENPKFIQEDRDKQILKLEEYAAALIKENKPVIDMAMLDVA